MAWVAFDRAVKTAEQLGGDLPVDRWRKIRDTIHDEVCDKGWNPRVRAFTQAYDTHALGASLLIMCQTGFISHNDPRMLSTLREAAENLGNLRVLTNATCNGWPGDTLHGDRRCFS